MSLPDQTGLSWPAISTAQSGTSTGVRSAIARAAGATGVDFQYLMAQARLESSLDPKARAATSSASGLFQFTNATWLQTLQKHGDMLGGNASTLAALSDPSARAQVLALRSDPDVSAMMAASLAADHQDALSGVLGRQPDASELYLAHFLGIEGAGKFLSALNTSPDQSAAALLPKAAGANRAIFFDGNGTPRSVADVMDLIRGKMSGAMQANGASDGAMDFTAMPASFAAASPEEPSGGPIAREWAAAQAELGQGQSAPRSMADTLAASFGGNSGSAPDFVRSAYDRFKSFGM